MLSVHTSPLEQPGTGDAGGMNVYVVELSRRLAALGVEVEVFTRRTSGAQADLVELSPGVLVRHVDAGPYEGLAKEELPGQLCAFTAGLMRAAAAAADGHYDLVHSHYWLSGQVGWLFAERWGVPLVHTMHTMAKVKNAALAEGDVPEPRGRVIGEQQVVDAADRLVANTAEEAADLVSHYGADPDRVGAVPPGVDLELFSPGDRAAARARLGLPADADVLLFVGRIQPLKGPDVLVAAAARMRARRGAGDRPLVVAVLGGPSGSGLARPTALLDQAAQLGVGDVLLTRPPVARAELADWYRAADLVTVPSHNESFGLVALEAQACGTPVVAASVGGLRRAVSDGVSGVLVPGHDPGRWAVELDVLLADPGRRAAMGRSAVAHASGFGWDRTAQRVLREYDRAAATFAHRRPAPLPLLEASG
ncbi:D-inositol-3-phosphate glycosyltransferase [Aquipuribacter hungaricus]|uniref:D-inositol-3-phosphate glycosyltransferase n=1 Tax=Aquipuribacter hungaricus TaxID=545624 RepID=A0ABV7WCE9_9MICO